MKPLFAAVTVGLGLMSFAVGVHAQDWDGPPPSMPAQEWHAAEEMQPAFGFGFGARLEAVRRLYSEKLARYRLASALSTQETAIGIRDEQKAAWRAYTQALLAMVPERAAIMGLIGEEDMDGSGPQAFGRAEALADALSVYATKADALKKAIAELRSVLSPAQLEAARVPSLVRG